MMTYGINKIDLSHPKCNPFQYLTQVAMNCFIQKIKQEKKYRQAQNDLTTKIYNEYELQENIKSTQKEEDND